MLITEKGKQIVKSIFGEGPKDAKQLGQGVYKNYGIAKSGFNISSIQFAIHYVFESILTLNNFIKNVAQSTQLNGYFIGTSYDGNTVFKELKSKKIGESLSIFEDETKICEVTKQYDNSEFENDDDWDSTIEGDTTDVGFNIHNDQAEYYVLGEKIEEEIIETTDSSWKRIKNADNQS